LLTANLWNGRAQPDALAAVIDQHQPDVVLTQEMSPAQAQTLARLLPHGLLLPSRDGRGMGIAARWPLAVTRIALPHRDALATQVELADPGGSGTTIEIINVHLSAPTRLHRIALRREQVRGLRAHLERTSIRRVLAGDLNSLPLMPAYRALRHHLDDAALGRAERPSPTWSPSARARRLLRIDHVLVAGLRALELQVLRIAGSDHSALLVTLALR
jgi:endonuclease/exonuclease/phosphatase (EEP) superfamily protein YafD